MFMDIVTFLKIINGFLKQTENLYLIGENQFAFMKCNQLYESIVKIFSKKWKIDTQEKDFEIKFLGKIKSISESFSNIFKNLQKLRMTDSIETINENDVERYISNLKQIFLAIKINAQKDTICQIPTNKNSEINLENKNKFIGNLQNTDRINGIKEKNYDDNIWISLKSAILEFEEQKSKNIEISK